MVASALGQATSEGGGEKFKTRAGNEKNPKQRTLPGNEYDQMNKRQREKRTR